MPFAFEGVVVPEHTRGGDGGDAECKTLEKTRIPACAVVIDNAQVTHRQRVSRRKEEEAWCDDDGGGYACAGGGEEEDSVAGVDARKSTFLAI